MTPTQLEVNAHKLDAITSKVRLIAGRNGREDLAERLQDSAKALTDTSVRVVFVGQFKQGKSALVNALVEAAVCPVDDVLATSVPTVVRWGETTSAALVTEFAEQARTLRTEIDPSKLREHVTDLAGQSGFLGSLRAEVTLQSPLLADGLVLIDTPGVGRARARASTNLTLLPEADVAIMVTDATQEFTDPELTFLKQAIALCPRVVGVVSKIDLQYQWRDIVLANTEHLAAADIDIPVLVTSALLKDLATQEADPLLREESQVDALAAYLHDDVRTNVLSERHRAVASDISAVSEHLAMAFEAELEALNDAGTGAGNGKAIVQSLEQAETNASKLAQRTARWQQTLSDGAGELSSDIEFDLRDRLREVGREAEQLIGSSDPGKVWDDIGAWLADSVTQAVSDNFVWAHQRSVHLAEVVAQHFSLDGKAAVPSLALDGADQALSAIGGLDYIHAGRLSIGQKLMIGMKGSYGGVLMFGLLTTLAGMALVNPISIVAGLIMGGFGYRQDASQRLEQRRGEAKSAVRKLIDESIFQVSKESRDRMGRIKRILRDHFISVAEDLKRSLNESVRMAKNGAQIPATERERRAQAVAAELDELRKLCEAAEQLTINQPEAPDRAEPQLAAAQGAARSTANNLEQSTV